MTKLKLLLVVAFIMGSLFSCAGNQRIVLKIPGQKGKPSIGTIALMKADKGTRYAIDLSKGLPNTNYHFSLHGGKGKNLSASLIVIDQIKTDARGKANKSGRLKYRGAAEIRFEDIVADDHTILIRAQNEEYRLTIPKNKV